MSTPFDPRPDGDYRDGFVLSGILISSEKIADDLSRAESLQQLDEGRRRYEQSAFDSAGTSLGLFAAWMANQIEAEIGARNALVESRS